MRFKTQIDNGAALTLEKELFVGVNCAVSECRPVTVGFQLQVAVSVGYEPAVETARQPAIRLPLRKNLTLPAVFTVTDVCTAMPFDGLPPSVMPVIVPASLTFNTVMVTV